MDRQSLYVVDFFMQIGAFETTEGIVNNVWLISWRCPASVESFGVVSIEVI